MTLNLRLFDCKINVFQDSWWNVSVSSLVILAASVLSYRVDKQTDRQTAVKNQTHAAAASMGNNMAKISTQMLERV